MDTFLTSPVFWLLIGVFFLLIETTHYAFILVFFGIGALIVALISWIGLTNSLPADLIIFLFASLLSLFLFREKMSRVFKGKISGKLRSGESVDEFIGKKAVVISDITPGKLDGKIEFYGTNWNAQSDEIIAKGSVVEIIERNNLVYKVKKND
ncbi:hypothetical protein BH10BAC5_BH10BAC5_21800 [soil metagenome]